MVTQPVHGMALTHSKVCLIPRPRLLCIYILHSWADKPEPLQEPEAVGVKQTALGVAEEPCLQLVSTELFGERLRPGNAEGAGVNFPNHAPSYLCFTPLEALLNNTVSSDGRKVCVTLTASIDILISTDQATEKGVLCTSPKIQ